MSSSSGAASEVRTTVPWASRLSVALGVAFVWVVVLLARDDGAVDEQVAQSVQEHPEP